MRLLRRMTEASVLMREKFCHWTLSFRQHAVLMPTVHIWCWSAGTFFSGDPQLHTVCKWQCLSLSGIPTYVLLNTTGISSPARVDHLELLSISGGSLKTIPVKHYPDRKPYGIWNISDFVPPDEAFFLKVTGYDKDGYLFQRVSSVSFSSIVPGKTMFHSTLQCQ